MNQLLRVTQVIYSSLILGSEGKSAAVPTGPGVFDLALNKMVEEGMFPKWLRDQLHFVQSAGGLMCLEAGEIQGLAMEMKIISNPNPSYIRSEIQVTAKVARHSLSRLAISEEEAVTWGRALRAALEQAEARLELANI
jgi:hypothetical protein